MAEGDNEEERLRSVAQRNAMSILQARRRAETELREHSEWLRVTLSSIGDAVITTDAEGRVTFMNPVAETLTGWQQADALGQMLSEVLHIVNEASRAPVENPALRALTQGVVVGLANHTILIAKDGTERPIDDSAAPIRASGGAIIGCVLVFRDVSERHDAEMAQRATEQALRASQTDSDRQRRLYEAILTNTPDLAFVFDLDHRFIYANDVLLKTWGKTREEAIGNTCRDVGYEEWHAALHDREIDQVIATKRAVRGEVPFTGSFGRRIYDYIMVPVLDASGEVEAVAGTTRDVTERKLDSEAAGKLAAIVESSDDAIVTKGLDGIIASWNQGAERMFGYTAAEVVGQDIRLIIPAERRSEEDEVLARLRRGEKIDHFETERQAKDGSRLNISLTVSPVKDSAGRIVGASKIARDITHRKRAELEREQLLASERPGTRPSAPAGSRTISSPRSRTNSARRSMPSSVGRRSCRASRLPPRCSPRGSMSSSAMLASSRS